MSNRTSKSFRSALKVQFFSTLFAGAVFLCGCSSTTTFTAFHSAQVFQGKGGGLLWEVDGIEFSQGDVSRKYRILGMLEVRHKRVPFARRLSELMPVSHDHDSAIAKIAHEKGGDAVLVISPPPEPPKMFDDQDQDDQKRHRQPSKYVIIKYAEEPPGLGGN